MTVLFTEPDPDLFLVHLEQVFVFQSGAWLVVLTLDDTVDHGSLKIKDTKRLRDTLHSVLHDNQLHWRLVLHTDGVDSVNTRQKTVVVSSNMGKVGFLDSLEGIEIAVGHRLDDELLILGEEEKAATLTL